VTGGFFHERVADLFVGEAEHLSLFVGVGGFAWFWWRNECFGRGRAQEETVANDGALVGAFGSPVVGLEVDDGEGRQRQR
jgi:hypothetical protein